MGQRQQAHSMSSELSPIQESAHGLLRWRCSSLAHLTGQQWVAPVLRDSLTKPPGGLYGLGKGQGLLKRQLPKPWFPALPDSMDILLAVVY